MRQLWICVFFATAACADIDQTTQLASDQAEPASTELTVAERHSVKKDIVVIAVRHAERGTDDPSDPSLSEAGQLRAQSLATALEHANVTAIYTTQFRRTQQTAIPLSEATGVPVTVRPIDATNIATYAADLNRHIRRTHRGDAVLVVGHSNTIPDLVTAISGVTVPPISESEYTRFYTITIGADVRVIASRY